MHQLYVQTIHGAEQRNQFESEVQLNGNGVTNRKSVQLICRGERGTGTYLDMVELVREAGRTAYCLELYNDCIRGTCLRLRGRLLPA